MSEPSVMTDTSPELQVDSKKRKAESSLSDLKKQQLAEARQKKLQKAQEREQEMLQLKSKLNQFESKLKDTETKLTNSEVDKQVQTENIENPKRQKVVTVDSEEKPEKKQSGFFKNLLDPETVIRGTALMGAAAASYYYKNVWTQPAKIEKPVPIPSSVTERPATNPNLNFNRSNQYTHPSQMPITSLFSKK